MALAELLWVDSAGFYLALEAIDAPERRILRVPFPRPVLEERDARSALTMMAQVGVCCSMRVLDFWNRDSSSNGATYTYNPLNSVSRFVTGSVGAPKTIHTHPAEQAVTFLIKQLSIMVEHSLSRFLVFIQYPHLYLLGFHEVMANK